MFVCAIASRWAHGVAPVMQAGVAEGQEEASGEKPWPDLDYPAPPMVRIHIQGRPYTALVDSGAVVTLVAERVLWEINSGVVRKRAPALQFADGSVSPPAEIRGFRLAVGPWAGDVEAIVLHSKHVDFIIGWGLIQRMKASVDSVANRLQIAGTEGTPLLEGRQASVTAATVAAVDTDDQVVFETVYPGATLPQRATAGSYGYDVTAAEAKTVPSHGRAKIRTGWRVKGPEGFMPRLMPRSGLAANAGIDIGAGVIDFDYRGEVHVVVFNHDRHPLVVEVGDKIAQLVFVKVATPDVTWGEVDSDTERGDGGFFTFFLLYPISPSSSGRPLSAASGAIGEAGGMKKPSGAGKNPRGEGLNALLRCPPRVGRTCG